MQPTRWIEGGRAPLTPTTSRVTVPTNVRLIRARRQSFAPKTTQLGVECKFGVGTPFAQFRYTRGNSMSNGEHPIREAKNHAGTGCSTMRRAPRFLVGICLVVLGASQRSLFGGLVAAIGTALAASSLLEGRLPVLRGFKQSDVLPASPEGGDATWDRVDEASWESFPSSDPPAIP